MIWVILIPAVLYVCVILFLQNGLLKLGAGQNRNDFSFSVVIAARNEERNIRGCIESVFSQNIPSSSYEVIVVNDRSEDSTPAILSELQSEYPNLRVVDITETVPGISPKKNAVSKGIDAAGNEIIVFTDADCIVSSGWLSAISRFFASDTGLVQGITCYRFIPGMNRIFFGLQTIDFLSHGIVAASAIGANLPINSNANNFAFRRKVFEEIGGYGNKANRVVSGDDDLLLQRVWKSGRWNVTFMADPAGTVETNPTPTVSAAFDQRKRWGSQTVHYCAPQVALLSSVFIFYLSIVLSFVVTLFDKSNLPLFLSQLLVKMAGETALLIPGTRIFRKKELRAFIPLASLVQLPMVIAAVLLGVFGRFGWKGQSFSRTVEDNRSAQTGSVVDEIRKERM
ncbi:MAG: glycosyltransferase [Fibrobacterota bacterium]